MNRRRQCENVNDENDGNEDRLSDLPEEVLLHILSLLDTKQAVQSCVLSTRWRHLWKRIPTLKLYASSFSTPKQFAIFVYKILTLRDTSIALQALDIKRHGNIPTLKDNKSSNEDKVGKHQPITDSPLLDNGQ